MTISVRRSSALVQPDLSSYGPLRPGVVPEWLGARIRGTRVGLSADDALGELDGLDWLDHWGADSAECFCSEPYGLTQNHMSQLLRFCERFKLQVNIAGRSHHFPGKTLRITIWPRAES